MLIEAASAFQRSLTHEFNTANTYICNVRSFSTNLPEDIARAAQSARFPSKRSLQGSTPLESSTDSLAAVAPVTPFNPQLEGAKVATTWMFPWERRQMEGGKLKAWEKLYWGAFVVAIALFLFNRLPKGGKEEDEEDPQIAEERKAKKVEFARKIAAGQSIVGDEDLFEGEEPEAIQDFIKKLDVDPYEGLSPEEINALVNSNN